MNACGFHPGKFGCKGSKKRWYSHHLIIFFQDAADFLDKKRAVFSKKRYLCISYEETHVIISGYRGTKCQRRTGE